MNEQFEAVLTGSDGPIDGIVTELTTGSGLAYKFQSIDESLELTIIRNEEGNWERVSGTEPYFSGWVDELTEQIQNNKTAL
ncbi:hypothetical protein LT679_03305 [Mucilaginibacter roseus]|uniref:Uncharacterized protein n=1 Tax=Mucilaginibacter roseus TaxID=1528868 RepID=A0ABS8U125_9SPHI|nr:hypothetical protein [Mucilaginibacter roseus]MCD8739619.1 hypothetical protein [Mucilaginibacter roseus]